ncbi:MAG: phenylalanine--tRNA ligase subunit beta [Candidatus Omnitrophota bacterium]
MKVSFNWLKDFVEIKKSPEELAHLLTMAGLEVKGIEKKLGDAVFEIEITSNRPDWLSIIGVAREVGAITNKKFQPKADPPQAEKIKNNSILQIDVQDKKACSLYTACLIKDVQVGPSPKWLRERLEVLGLRSINNVVDITNYVMLETGQPLHAFDYDKLVLPIIVRRAKDSEEILLIDGSARKLTSEALVIADNKKAIAVAGVIGGKDSEVTGQTKNILLESAYFDPVTIRNIVKKIAISTDSSYRFERSVDIQGVEHASFRAVNLICEAAVAKPIAFVRSKKIATPKRTIIFDVGAANKILGISLSPVKVKSILKNLGLSIIQRNKQLVLAVPSFRPDLKISEDVTEEIARIFGYNNIPLTYPAISKQLFEKSKYDFINQIRDMLVGFGLSEAKTYSLISRQFLQKSNEEQLLDKSNELQNPLSLEFEVLRPTLFASLISCLGRNINRKNHNLRLFEISNIFLEKEALSLGIIVCGEEVICTDKQKNNIKNDFYYLKGIVENLLGKLKVYEVNFLESGDIIARGKKIGIFKHVSRQLCSNFDIKNKDEVFFSEIYLEELAKIVNCSIKYNPFSLFPAISRDISVNIKEEIKFQQIEELIINNAGNELSEIKLIDVYRGKNIPEDHKNFTFSLTWQAKNRTLEEKEIEALQKNICEKLVQGLSAQIR